MIHFALIPCRAVPEGDRTGTYVIGLAVVRRVTAGAKVIVISLLLDLAQSASRSVPWLD